MLHRLSSQTLAEKNWCIRT